MEINEMTTAQQATLDKMTDRKAELQTEIDQVRTDLAEEQAALSSEYMQSKPTSAIEAKIVKLRGREAALQGALEESEAVYDQTAGKLADAELKAQRKELDALAKEQNREAAEMVKSAYALFDKAQAQTRKAVAAKNMVSRHPDNLSWASIRPGATVGSVFELALYRALVDIEHAYPDIAKKAGHKRVTRGYK